MDERQSDDTNTTHQMKNRRLVKGLVVCLVGMMVQASIIVLAVYGNADNPTTIPGFTGAMALQGAVTVTLQTPFTMTVIVTNTSETPGTVDIGVFSSITQGLTADSFPSGCTLNSQETFIGVDCSSTVPAGDHISFDTVWIGTQPGTYPFQSSGSFSYAPFSDFVSGFTVAVITPTVPSPPPTVEVPIRKLVSPTTVQAGGIVTYSIAVTNTGTTSLTNFVISDTMPAGITVLGATPGQGSCLETDDSATCFGTTLAPNDVYTLTLAGGVAPGMTGPLTNTAVITDTTGLDVSSSAILTVTAPDIDGNGTDDTAELNIDYVQAISGSVKGPYLGYVSDPGTDIILDSRLLTTDEQSAANVSSGNQVITVTMTLSNTIQTDVQIHQPPFYRPMVRQSGGDGAMMQTNSASTTRANGSSTPPANAYLKFGPTPDNPTPHFYLFNFDGETGVVRIEANVMTLRFVDGKRGDDDLSANGVIVDPGAPVFVASEAAMAPGANTPQDTTAAAGASDVPMLQFAAGAPNAAVRIESVTVGTSGSGNDASDVTAVKVYLDVDGDGQVGAGDTQLASGTFGADDGSVVLPLNPVQDLAANGSANFLVTYDFNTTLVAAASRKFRLVRATTGLQTPLSGPPGTLSFIPLLLGMPLLAGMLRLRRGRRLMILVLLIVGVLWLVSGCNLFDDGGGGGGATRTFTATLNGVTATDPNSGGAASAVTGLPVTGATVTVR